MLRVVGGRASGDTKTRILDTAEALFIAHGYEAMSLRQITSTAQVNLAAVNYHFGTKELLIQALFARRLDYLNAERIRLLNHYENALGKENVSCEHVLGAMFLPALRLSRDRELGNRDFLRLLGRVYTDPSPFVRTFLEEHYAPVSERFFEAFAVALPDLPRNELGWRLHFVMGALACFLASTDSNRLIQAFAGDHVRSDAHIIMRLTSLMVAALRAPMPDSGQMTRFTAIVEQTPAEAY